jgi:hypothetical protein
VLGTGCASVGHYFEDRGRDLADIVDLKGGESMGLGVKVEATLYLGVGLGIAEQGRSVEWYGRERVRAPVNPNKRFDGMFVHLIVLGGDTYRGGMHGWSDDPSWLKPGPPATYNSLNFLALNMVALRNRIQPPFLDRFRFGGEVLLPEVQGGIYLNVGQILDFVLGIFTIDIGDDDRAGVVPEEEAPDEADESRLVPYEEVVPEPAEQSAPPAPPRTARRTPAPVQMAPPNPYRSLSRCAGRLPRPR